jgi:hypothetical protein
VVVLAVAGSSTLAHEIESIDLNVRGQIPKELDGCLFVAASRRHKDRSRFSRWHDSQADLIRLDIQPPGRVRAHVLQVDPTGSGLPGGDGWKSFYATQPNHGVNLAGDHGWFTNLLYGAPLEVDLRTWTPTRVLRYVELDDEAPQLSNTSHFAWSLDHRFAYFHQSRLLRERAGRPVLADDLRLVQLDTATGAERTWTIVPPPEDKDLVAANFHSAFYYEEGGRRYVGLLRTGAVMEYLAPHGGGREHAVARMPASTIWTIEIVEAARTLSAQLLPGIGELGGLALSHLACDATSGEGFVLYANFKEADVAEETHGVNCYGEPAASVLEHYDGMVIEPLNVGMVIRYERRDGSYTLRTLRRNYDFGHTSQGHTWLPINLEIDPTGEHVFASFAGFHPRLLPRHVADTYPERIADMAHMRYVPPLLMRIRADTLEPDVDRKRSYLSYAEPVATAVVGDQTAAFVCTFSPEIGLRVYPAGDLQRIIAHAVAARLHSWRDTHFRPDPPHMQFARLG